MCAAQGPSGCFGLVSRSPKEPGRALENPPRSATLHLGGRAHGPGFAARRRTPAPPFETPDSPASIDRGDRGHLASPTDDIFHRPAGPDERGAHLRPRSCAGIERRNPRRIDRAVEPRASRAIVPGGDASRRPLLATSRAPRYHDRNRAAAEEDDRADATEGLGPGARPTEPPVRARRSEDEPGREGMVVGHTRPAGPSDGRDVPAGELAVTGATGCCAPVAPAVVVGQRHRVLGADRVATSGRCGLLVDTNV